MHIPCTLEEYMRTHELPSLQQHTHHGWHTQSRLVHQLRHRDCGALRPAQPDSTAQCDWHLTATIAYYSIMSEGVQIHDKARLRDCNRGLRRIPCMECVLLAVHLYVLGEMLCDFSRDRIKFTCDAKLCSVYIPMQVRPSKAMPNSQLRCSSLHGLAWGLYCIPIVSYTTPHPSPPT